MAEGSALMFSLPHIVLCPKSRRFASKGRDCVDDKLTTAATKTRIQKLLLLLETSEVNDAK